MNPEIGFIWIRFSCSGLLKLRLESWSSGEFALLCTSSIAVIHLDVVFFPTHHLCRHGFACLVTSDGQPLCYHITNAILIQKNTMGCT